MSVDKESLTDKHVREVAHAAVSEILLMMGADTSQPRSLQELQLDFAFIRSWRKSSDTVKTKSLGAAVFFIVTGILGYCVYLVRGHL
jgi:hypothetical protein